MSRRPGVPRDRPARPAPRDRPARPAPGGHRGSKRPAASPAAAPAADDDRLAAVQASLAARWAIILKRFRDYMHRT